MPRIIRYLVIFLCFFGFVFIRFCESELFYDPLILFFKGQYQVAQLPEININKLLLHISFRYVIHMLLSLLILWMAFVEKGIVKFAVALYIFVFVVLMTVLMFLLNTYQIGDAAQVFYIRRFLIQPLLIFILLPAFFYYRKVNS